MKLSFRWYGADDPVSLEYISQIPGMRSVVSAVYDVKPGGVWSRESLAAIAEACRTHGLVFDVVESIPVHEDIKLGRPDADSLIDNYCENIRRCAEVGVKCVTYNFMPVFDWTRSELDRRAADGSTSLVLYTDSLRGLDPLHEDIHLPGWDASYTQDEVRGLIAAYSELGEEGLWHSLEHFLCRVIPVAEDGDTSGRSAVSDLRSAAYHHLRGKSRSHARAVRQPGKFALLLHRLARLCAGERHSRNGAQVCRRGPHSVHAYTQCKDNGRRIV